MESLIIITPDDTVMTADYDGLKSLQKAVDGYIELFGKVTFPHNNLTTLFYCNEDFRFTHNGEFCKVNALATSLTKIPVYGNVVIEKVTMPSDNPSNQDDMCEPVESGFTNDETQFIKGYFDAFIHKRNDILSKCHKNLDCVLHI